VKKYTVIAAVGISVINEPSWGESIKPHYSNRPAVIYRYLFVRPVICGNTRVYCTGNSIVLHGIQSGQRSWQDVTQRYYTTLVCFCLLDAKTRCCRRVEGLIVDRVEGLNVKLPAISHRCRCQCHHHLHSLLPLSLPPSIPSPHPQSTHSKTSY